MSETSYSQEAWERLGRAVRRRRRELGYSQAKLEAIGGPSAGVTSKIETASKTDYTDRVFVPLEKGLRWAPGTVDAILRDDQAALDALGGELPERLMELIGDDEGHAYVARNPHYTPDEIEMAIRSVDGFRSLQAKSASRHEDIRRRA